MTTPSNPSLHRLLIPLEPDLDLLLKEERVTTGASYSEIARRALRYYLAERRNAKARKGVK